ncbi:MAG: zinc ribbon domain-containing protein [Verrucomicrobia bacterium]|nr:zinc ribbon domain-containing protein [Verrucomicrobiota bacterium]NMD18960.1 zinc ribbon domain-containing protein [Verrucomicrobiota bacterium]OQC67084.1 MAG: Zinc ribbon domain protein [Verrucomicrobia bacterium ADurb.Bin006]
MPTYHYMCEKCGHEFDHFQSMSDSPLKTCLKEKCGRKTWGKGRVKRVLSGGAGLIFKGSGFYITDYRSEGYKTAAKKESEVAAPKKDASSTAKKETKSEKPASST